MCFNDVVLCLKSFSLVHQGFPQQFLLQSIINLLSEPSNQEDFISTEEDSAIEDYIFVISQFCWLLLFVGQHNCKKVKYMLSFVT